MVKKRFYILGCLLTVTLIFSGCSISNPFKKSNSEASTEATKEEQNKDGQGIDVVGSGSARKTQVENQFMTERKSLENNRENKSKSDIAAFDNDIKAKDSQKQKEYSDKISKDNSEANNMLKKELQIELKRISNEYTNEKARIEAEYKAEVEKNKTVSQSNSLVTSSEKNKADKLYNAEKQKAEKEKIAKDKNAAKVAELSKKQENLNNTYNNIWNEYNKKIKLAAEEIDSNKKSLKEKINKEYDEKLKKLIDDEIINDTIWSNMIVSEDKEITNYYNEQDDIYKKLVNELIKWRDNQLLKFIK